MSTTIDTSEPQADAKVWLAVIGSIIGAFIAVLTRPGSVPCETAVASSRMNQANRSTSRLLRPIGMRDAGSAHNRQVTASAPSR